MRTLLTLLLVVLVGAAATAPVQAQQAAVDENVFRQLIAVQMVESLQSPNAMVRHQTLKNAIVYSTLHKNRVDLAGVVASIAQVAEQDMSDSNRRLAMAALRSMDTYRARQYLARLEGMADDEYRSLVAGVLTEYQENKLTGSL